MARDRGRRRIWRDLLILTAHESTFSRRVATWEIQLVGKNEGRGQQPAAQGRGEILLPTATSGLRRAFLLCTALLGATIRGTDVPAEERSTASAAEIYVRPTVLAKLALDKPKQATATDRWNLTTLAPFNFVTLSEGTPDGQ